MPGTRNTHYVHADLRPTYRHCACYPAHICLCQSVICLYVFLVPCCRGQLRPSPPCCDISFALHRQTNCTQDSSA